jgi:hypothetical protein
MMPALMINICLKAGRKALTLSEIFILVFGNLEYLGLWILFFKTSIAISQLKKVREDSADLGPMPWDSRFDSLKNWPPILLTFVLLCIIAHHVSNEYFFRKVLSIWEDNIIEDYFEEHEKVEASRFGISINFHFRFLNYKAWIPLWKEKGHIVPFE